MKQILLLSIICGGILIAVVLAIRSERRKKFYVNTFAETYEQHSVKESLEFMLSLYKRTDKEYKAVNKALYYLDHSIMRDYETAFRFIEKDMKCRELKLIHQKILDEEKSKMVLSLPYPKMGYDGNMIVH